MKRFKTSPFDFDRAGLKAAGENVSDNMIFILKELVL